MMTLGSCIYCFKTSKHHEALGTDRITSNGFFDSSLISAEYNETARVRAIKKTKENQK